MFPVPRFVTAVVLSACCLALTGCGRNKNLTKENFDKINTGMTLQEVQTLLGAPGEEDAELSMAEGSSVAGAVGVGGSLESMTPKKSATKWYKWSSGSKSIKVAFHEGKVAASNFKQSEGLR
jgi:hypothetical protein